MEELLDTPNIARFRDATRMSRNTFDGVQLLLEANGGFKHFKYLETGEKLLIFILILVGHTIRSVNERWQLSDSPISLVVHGVADVMILC